MNKAVYYSTNQKLSASERSAMVTDLGDGVEVEWGNDNAVGRYKVISKSEDYFRDFEHHKDILIGITPLKYSSNNAFLTIALDHEIHICSRKGRLLDALRGHQSRILGVIELNHERLLSLDESGVVKLWNLNHGELIVSLDSVAQDPYSISVFENSHHFVAPDVNGIGIWSYDGVCVALLEGIKSDISSILHLSNGNWLVSCQGCYPGIWKSSGELANEFLFTFNFERDLIELEAGQLLVRDVDGHFVICSGDGELLYCHEPNESLSTLFDRLLSDSKSAIEFIQSHPNILDYDHAINPTGQSNSIVNGRTLLERHCVDLTDPVQERFWNFFNRPIIANVRRALQAQVKHSHEGLNTVTALSQKSANHIKRHQKYRAKQARSSILWLCFSVFSLVISYAMGAQYQLLNGLSSNVLSDRLGVTPTDSMQLAQISGMVAIFALLLSGLNGYGSRKHRSRFYTQQDNHAFLEQVPPVLHYLIETVKIYRDSILHQVPVVKDPDVFASESLREEIRQLVDGKLMHMALAECGIDHVDIISKGNKPLIIRDWSILQSMKQRYATSTKLQNSNEASFWSSEGAMYCAVQLLHYVLLTRNCVYVFTTFYDLVAAKSFGTEVHAFKYGNIANISKREVKRSSYAIFETDDLPATELTISSISGEKIRLTVLDEGTAEAILASVTSVEAFLAIERLESEKQDYEADESLSEEQRALEIAVLDGQINDFKNSVMMLSTGAMNQDIEEGIRYIRHRLYKQDLLRPEIRLT